MDVGQTQKTFIRISTAQPNSIKQLEQSLHLAIVPESKAGKIEAVAVHLSASTLQSQYVTSHEKSGLTATQKFT